MDPPIQVAVTESSSIAVRRPSARWLTLLFQQPGLWAIPAAIGLSFGLELHAVEHGPILCVSRLAFGMPCGGCGLTRGYVAFAHGQLWTAIRYNPLTPLLYLWMVGWWLASVGRLARGLPVARSPQWLGLTALVGFGLLWLLRTVGFFSGPDWAQTIAREALPVRLWMWLVSQAL